MGIILYLWINFFVKFYNLVELLMFEVNNCLLFGLKLILLICFWFVEIFCLILLLGLIKWRELLLEILVIKSFWGWYVKF